MGFQVGLSLICAADCLGDAVFGLQMQVFFNSHAGVNFEKAETRIFLLKIDYK